MRTEYVITGDTECLTPWVTHRVNMVSVELQRRIEDVLVITLECTEEV